MLLLCRWVLQQGRRRDHGVRPHSPALLLRLLGDPQRTVARAFTTLSLDGPGLRQRPWQRPCSAASPPTAVSLVLLGAKKLALARCAAGNAATTIFRT